METVTREYKVFSFAELSYKAKETARNWHRERHLIGWEWWESVYECYKTAGRMLGIRIDKIYFSGFWNQGDGACFEGAYTYNREWRDQLPTEFGGDLLEKFLAFGALLEEIQKPHNFELSASIKHSGRYYHEYETTIEVESGESEPEETDIKAEQEKFSKSEEELIKALRQYMKEIYKALEADYEYFSSDAAIEESIIANEYKFFEDGKIFNL